MRCTVTHRGVPLVAVELLTTETTLDLAPAELLPGYRQVLAPLFRRAEEGERNTENLARGWCMTEEATLAAKARVTDGSRALARLAAIERDLELRDLAGALVPTDVIHVMELSFARPDTITVFVQLRETHAPVPALQRSPPRTQQAGARDIRETCSPSQGGPMAREGAEPILPARDVPNARAFYESLGFTAGYRDDRYDILRRGTLVVHLEAHDELAPGENHASCYWRVPDADALYREFAALGLPAEGSPSLSEPFDEPWGMREFALRDPAGNLIRVGHELVRAGAADR